MLARLAKASKALTALLDAAADLESYHFVEEPFFDETARENLLDSAGACGKGVYENALTWTWCRCSSPAQTPWPARWKLFRTPIHTNN